MKITSADVRRGLAAAVDLLSAGSSLVGSPGGIAFVSNTGALVNARVPHGMPDVEAHAFAASVEHARLAELRGPGSALAALRAAQAELAGAARTRAVHGRRASKDDVIPLVVGLLDATDAQLFVSAVDLAGASRLAVDPRAGSCDSVDLGRGYEFRHSSKPSDKRVVIRSPRLLVADAFLESVAELHAVLDGCARAGDPLLVCCRGASDDVLHTLAVNRARGTLEAHALVFPLDFDVANTLVDIAVVAGCDVVSSLKGQLLVSVDPGSLPRVESAVLLGDFLELREPSAAVRVEKHRAVLLERVLEAGNSSSVEMLESRIAKLSACGATVRLERSLGHRARVERWDSALRALQAAGRGVAAPEPAEWWPGRELVPLASAAAAYELGASLAQLLSSLDAAV